MLQHNVSTPRPYDRINLIQGTKGIFRAYPPRIFIDEQEGGHNWATMDKYKERYESELWKKEGETARKLGGHGGMDYLMCYRLIQCMREGLEPDINVYDAAAWSVPGPLSERSVATGSMPEKTRLYSRSVAEIIVLEPGGYDSVNANRWFNRDAIPPCARNSLMLRRWNLKDRKERPTVEQKPRTSRCSAAITKLGH
jgi:hypothetical protein